MKSSIQHYAFRSGLPHEFELVSLEQLLGQHSGILTNPHRTGFYQILWFESGDTTLLVDFIPFRVKPGTLIFLDKSSVRRFIEPDNVTGRALLFTDDFYCRIEEDRRLLLSGALFSQLLGPSIIRISSSYEKNSLIHLYTLMDKEYSQNKDRYQAGILRSLLQAMLFCADREVSQRQCQKIGQSAQYECVRKFSELLELDFRMHKPVSFYAEAMFTTRKKLTQATSEVFGKSPKEVIDERIILEAKRLLVHTSESVKQISYTLGFDEPTNFSKFFRRHSGTTPLEFRDLNQTA